MSCSEKKKLQDQCTASWNALESAFQSLGVELDPKIGDIMPRLAKALSSAEGMIDPRTGTLRSPYFDAIALLAEHGKASALLSRHLHTHRC